MYVVIKKAQILFCTSKIQYSLCQLLMHILMHYETRQHGTRIEHENRSRIVIVNRRQVNPIFPAPSIRTITVLLHFIHSIFSFLLVPALSPPFKSPTVPQNLIIYVLEFIFERYWVSDLETLGSRETSLKAILQGSFFQTHLLCDYPPTCTRQPCLILYFDNTGHVSLQNFMDYFALFVCCVHLHFFYSLIINHSWFMYSPHETQYLLLFFVYVSYC